MRWCQRRPGEGVAAAGLGGTLGSPCALLQAAVRRADHLEGLLQRQRQPPRAPNEAK